MAVSWLEAGIGTGGLFVFFGLFRFVNNRVNSKVDEATCRAHITSLETSQKTEIGHLRELLEADLERGRDRFDKMERQLSEHGSLLEKISISVAVLAQDKDKK